MNITESRHVPTPRFLTRARLDNLLGELRVVKSGGGPSALYYIANDRKRIAGPFHSLGEAVIARSALAERPTLHPANVLATGTTFLATADEAEQDRADPKRAMERRIIKRNRLRMEKWNNRAIAQAKEQNGL